jgi:hypothetical protein
MEATLGLISDRFGHRDQTVVFEAGMLDQEVYLGREKVTAGRLDPGQWEEVAMSSAIRAS